MTRRSLPARLARALWLSPPIRALRHARNQRLEAKAQARHLKARVEGLGRDLKPGPVVVSGFLEEALGIGRGGRRDIQLFDVELSTAEVERLIASADAILSLHRAEGFGLTLAEAFGMGRPALATGWSGNMEFMGRLAYALIPFWPVAVDDPSRTYGGDLGAGQVWADPDLDAAAVAIRKLAGEAALRAQVGAAGREAVARLADHWTKAALAEAPISRWSPPA
jgi:glycosyltransferase involved in cell wall biosynthesis